MDFIKKMKNRELLEMSLKMLVGIFVSFLVIILMEGMIYSIELNALKDHSTSAVFYSDRTTAYCIEESEDQYFVVCYDTEEETWSATGSRLYTRDECEVLNVQTVVFHAPNAFIFSITPVHYVIMAIFVLIVVGYFVYRFVLLNKDYTKIIDNFNKTGEIELGN